jgi:hypothetical protein
VVAAGRLTTVVEVLERSVQVEVHLLEDNPRPRLERRMFERVRSQSVSSQSNGLRRAGRDPQRGVVVIGLDLDRVNERDPSLVGRSKELLDR